MYFLGFIDGYYFISIDQDPIRTQRKTHITQLVINNIPSINTITARKIFIFFNHP